MVEEDEYLREVLSVKTLDRIPVILARREERFGSGESNKQNLVSSSLTKQESRALLMRLRTEHKTLSDADAERMIEQIVSTGHPELRIAVDRIKRAYQERENLDMLLKDASIGKSMAKILRHVLFDSPSDAKKQLKAYFESLDTVQKEYRAFKAFELIDQQHPRLRDLASDLFDPIAKRPF